MDMVGGTTTPLKSMKVKWDDYSHGKLKTVPNHQPVMVHSDVFYGKWFIMATHR